METFKLFEETITVDGYLIQAETLESAIKRFNNQSDEALIDGIMEGLISSEIISSNGIIGMETLAGETIFDRDGLVSYLVDESGNPIPNEPGDNTQAQIVINLKDLLKLIDSANEKDITLEELMINILKEQLTKEEADGS